MEKIMSRLDQAITYSFYLIFFLVPIVIYPKTFELFEFNKMWVTFGLSLIILFLWLCKIIISGKLIIRRTPFDIVILLFFLSQFLSTIFSIDRHVSIWGYYSRFNGGLLSTVCYIFLYYAFVSNLIPTNTSQSILKRLSSYKLIIVSLITGAAVALWGLPSHFGYDPTCFVFRGDLDVSCWTDSFQPMARIFSTLGQPNWLAAYLGVTLPFSIGMFLKYIIRIDPNLPKQKAIRILNFIFSISKKNFVLAILYLILSVLFYIDLIYSGSQSGFMGTWAGVLFFVVLYVFSQAYKNKKLSMKAFQESLGIKAFGFLIILLSICSFFLGTPVKQFDIFTLRGLSDRFYKAPVAPAKDETKQAQMPAVEAKPAVGELGGTDSGIIRRIVWKGALDIAASHPLLGTGVETFAFAYYKVKPKEHNLTSEWDFLYNKAHNEYLNFLATTGFVGLGTYLAFILYFLFFSIKKLTFSFSKLLSHEDASETLVQSYSDRRIISFALLGAYGAILFTNFFGFSVVIVNLYLFLIPAFIFELSGISNLYTTILLRLPKVAQADVQSAAIHANNHLNKKYQPSFSVHPFHVMLILIMGLVFLYLEFLLMRFWVADQRYAQGYNLDKFAGLQGNIDGNPHLQKANSMRPGEDLFADELSVNYSTLAFIAHQQNQSSDAARFAQEAINLSNGVVGRHPQNVVYYKSRTRLFYNLSQIDPKYFGESVAAIEKAEELAPTDSKIVYNKALLYAQAGKNIEAERFFIHSIELKPNYVDARHQFAVFYNEFSKADPSKAAEYREKASEQLRYILENIDPGHVASKELLKEIEGL